MIVRAFKWLLIGCLLPLAFVCSVLVSAIGDIPAVENHSSIDPESVAQAKSIAKRTLRQYANYNAYVILGINDKELNNLINLASHAIPRLRGKASIDEAGINYVFSWKLPTNPVGKYITAEGQIPKSFQGLDLGSFSLGFLTIPSTLINWTAENLLNIALGDNQGSVFMQSIRTVTTYQNLAQIHAQPPTDLKARIAKLGQRFSSFSGESDLFASNELTKHYYQFLSQQGKRLFSQRPVSLVSFLNPLFTETQRLSGDNPRAHNQAAILALGVYLGSSHFEKIIGPVSGSEKANGQTYFVTLAGRRDLRLHFIFSAVFKILSDNGISLAAGEIKELLDSYGGSGFSFADLAADKAGILFADMATQNDLQARRLQRLFSRSLEERHLFPAIADLPEGITKTQFEQRYQHINSKAYKAMERQIQRRIQGLLLYSQG
ncbi:MAG: hypothetical protein OQK12_02000 [Motiliproteus sp.]|nr:hypothetical protein [Motiliproteus sp.]